MITHIAVVYFKKLLLNAIQQLFDFDLNLYVLVIILYLKDNRLGSAF